MSLPACSPPFCRYAVEPLFRESLHNITVQERHDLRAGGGFVRAERGFARAVGDAALHRPEDRVGIIGAA